MSSMRTGFHSVAPGVFSRGNGSSSAGGLGVAPDRYRTAHFKLTGPGFGTLRSFTGGLLVQSATVSRGLKPQKQSCEDLTSVAEQLPYTSLKSDADSRGGAETWHCRGKRIKKRSIQLASNQIDGTGLKAKTMTTSVYRALSFRQVLAEQLPKSQLDELGLEQNLLKSEDLSCALACFAYATRATLSFSFGEDLQSARSWDSMGTTPVLAAAAWRVRALRSWCAHVAGWLPGYPVQRNAVEKEEVANFIKTLRLLQA